MMDGGCWKLKWTNTGIIINSSDFNIITKQTTCLVDTIGDKINIIKVV